MEVLCFTGGTKRRRRVSACVGLLTLALVLALAGATAAQSVTGGIRGTVTDVSGGVIPKAAVLVTDENTGVPRAVETGARGSFEVPNLQPGRYRIEVMVTGFKRFEQTGVTVSTGTFSLVDVRLEVGPIGETVTVSAQAPANIITLDSPAVARGIDEQQLRDLPRGSRDIQSFLYLNPNVAGTSDDIQFLGGRTYGVSYIQDGQASTNAIFGTVGNSAPGLDAIAEMQVLSNSYSAEYGGLAGVVVTTKRGGKQFHGTSFYDFNSNGLNALSYGQVLTGVTRNDPNSKTSVNRYGASFGGPIAGRTFFFANYEGLRDQSIQGGGRANLPSAALRAGDFSGANYKIKDPQTGLPFPDNIIPPERISAISQGIMKYFWPLPNQTIQATGLGVFQQYVPEHRKRERFDLRVDHEAGNNNTIFARGSYQLRDPRGFTFEAGNALTDQPIINNKLTTYALIGGWTSILSNTIVNEFRTGYNYDHSNQSSTLRATAVAAQLGIEAPPSIGPDVPGFPSFVFVGTTARPSNIADAGRNTNRLQNQNSFSIADNLSWLKGPHSIRTGFLVTRNSAIDGFGRGLNHRGRYQFGKIGRYASPTGNAFADFLLGLPSRVDEHVSTRGDLNGHSTDFAAYFQDDWRATKNLTLFLGLRYELAGAWNEKDLMLANFQATDGGYHIVANKEVWALLPPGLSDPSSPWYSHVKLASDVGAPNTLVNADKNNWSPRVGFAQRLDQQGKTVLRGGFGLFHPTAAVQGIRDLLAANEFRYTIQRSPGPFAHAFSQGVGIPSNDDFGTQGVFPNTQMPDIYQYNITIERELPWSLGFRASYLGSTMRNLLVLNEFNSLPPSTPAGWFCTGCTEQNYLRPFPLYSAYMNMAVNAGEGQFHAAQFELQRRWRKGFAINVAYTLAHSNSNAPDSGNSSLGVIQYDPYNIEADRGPDPYVVKHRVIVNATVDVPVGRNRKFGAQMPAWADALFGGWTVSTIFQARTGANLTPFFSLGYSSYTPYNVGFYPDTTGVWTGDTWRPDQKGDPKANIPAGLSFNPAVYSVPADGVFPGNTKRNSLVGPSNWIVNLAFYKDIITRGGLNVQFTAMLDNAFNHAQFFPGPGSGFLDLSDYLVNGVGMDNGNLGVLGSDAEGNVEGFATSRQLRLGIRARF
jgi:hypothetical protein